MAHSEATSRQHPARHAVGGKTVYGARVGILMMDTLFSRPLGDMGNAESWPFRARFTGWCGVHRRSGSPPRQRPRCSRRSLARPTAWLPMAWMDFRSAAG